MPHDDQPDAYAVSYYGRMDEMYEGSTTTPPVMSFIEPQKTPNLAPQFLEHQNRMWDQAVANANKVVIVGVAPPDPQAHQQTERLWDAIAETGATVVYCNRSRTQQFRHWAEPKKPDGEERRTIDGSFLDRFGDVMREIIHI
jgi:hypothetical protein